MSLRPVAVGGLVAASLVVVACGRQLRHLRTTDTITLGSYRAFSNKLAQLEGRVAVRILRRG